MIVETQTSNGHHRSDIVARGKDGRVVLLVELKAMNDSGTLGVLQALENLKTSDVLFGMFADFDKMAIFRRDYENPASPVLEIKTADVLSFYEPDFANKKISEAYFATLIEAWLRDYAFHWKSDAPPAFEQMRSIGLSERLAGGMTSRETVDVEYSLY